jgi:hypothetical protein
MNCRNVSCSAGRLVIDLYVEVGLHEPNLKSYIKNNEFDLRIYIGLDNTLLLNHDFEMKLSSIRIIIFIF